MAYGDFRIPLFTDTFDSEISSSWTQGHGDWDTWEWVSGGHIQPAATDTDAGMYRNDISPANNQYIVATVGTPAGGTTNWWEAYVRSATGTDESCYCCGWDNTSGTFAYNIWEVDSAFGWTGLAEEATGDTLGTGNTISIEAVGTTIRMGTDEGSGDAQRLVTSDATLSSGEVGVACYGDKTELRFTAVSGGNIGGNAPFKMDTFTEVSDPTLDNHTSDVGGSWQGATASSISIESATSSIEQISGPNVHAIGDEDPSSADYVVEIEGTMGNAATSDQIGVVVRAEDGASFDEDTSDYYYFRMLANAGWDLRRFNGGVGAAKGSNFGYWAAEGLDIDDPIRLKLVILGTDPVSLQAYIDYDKDGAGFSGYGSPITTVNDSDAGRVQGAGNAGVMLNQVNSRITWFEATELITHTATGAPSAILPTSAGNADTYTSNAFTFKQDTFTEASNTPLENHTSDIGGDWQGSETTSIDVLSATYDAAADGDSFRTSIGDEDPLSADYFVEVEGTLGDADQTNGFGAIIRAQDGAGFNRSIDPWYYFFLNGEGRWYLSRNISGSGTTLDSDLNWGTTEGIDVDDPIRLKVQMTGVGAAVAYKCWIRYNKDDAGWTSYALVADSTDTHAERIVTPGNAGMVLSYSNPRITYLNAESLLHTATGAPSAFLPTASGRAGVFTANTFKGDTFTHAGDPLLSTHTSNIGGDWQGENLGNFSIFTAEDSVGLDAGGFQGVIGDEDPSNADFIVEIEATLPAISGDANDRVGLIARADDGSGFNQASDNYYLFFMVGGLGWRLSRYDAGAQNALVDDLSWLGDEGIDDDDPIKMKLALFGSGATTRYDLYLDYNKDGAGFSGYQLVGTGTDASGHSGPDNVGIYLSQTTALITYFNAESLNGLEYGLGAPSVFLPTAAGSAYMPTANQFKYDAFHEATDTTLDNHTSNSGGAWQGTEADDLEITAATGDVRGTAGFARRGTVGDEDPTRADYFVECEVLMSDTVGNSTYLVVRAEDGATYAGSSGSSHFAFELSGSNGGWALRRWPGGSPNPVYDEDASWVNDNGLDGDDPVRMKLEVWTDSNDDVHFRGSLDFNKDDAGFLGYEVVTEYVHTTAAGWELDAGYVGFNLLNDEVAVQWFNAEYIQRADGTPSILLPTAAGVAKLERAATGAPSVFLPTVYGDSRFIGDIKVDTFTEASDTPLENHTSDSGGGWQGTQTNLFDIVAATNEVDVNGSGFPATIGDEDPAGTAYWAEVEVTLGGLGAANNAGMILCGQDGASFNQGTSSHYALLFTGSAGWQFVRDVAGSGSGISNDSSWIADEGLDADDPIRARVEIRNTASAVNYKLWLDYDKDGAGFQGYGTSPVINHNDTNALRILEPGNVGIIGRANFPARIRYFNSGFLYTSGDGAPSIILPTSSGVADADAGEVTATGAPSTLLPTSAGAAATTVVIISAGVADTWIDGDTGIPIVGTGMAG